MAGINRQFNSEFRGHNTKLLIPLLPIDLSVRYFINAIRQNGGCEECKSPERICNSWTITQKSFPKGRIRVVLVNENLGL